MGEAPKPAEALSRKWFLQTVLVVAGNQILGRVLEVWLTKPVSHGLAVFIPLSALTLFLHKESPQKTPLRLLYCVGGTVFVFFLFRW
jgi:hypothetical protein